MEDNIKIIIEHAQIQAAFQNACTEILKSGYNNPVKDLLEKSIKGQIGKIQEIVDGIISDALSNPEFKMKLADAVIGQLVAAAINKSR